jgi:hypothetical protein
MAWSTPFENPIPLPGGRRLLTLRDAAQKGGLRQTLDSHKLPLCFCRGHGKCAEYGFLSPPSHCARISDWRLSVVAELTTEKNRLSAHPLELRLTSDTLFAGLVRRFSDRRKIDRRLFICRQFNRCKLDPFTFVVLVQQLDPRMQSRKSVGR